MLQAVLWGMVPALLVGWIIGYLTGFKKGRESLL